MALLYCEGFESFAANAGDTQDGIEEKYTGSSGLGSVVLRSGRITGRSLELTNSTTILRSGLVLTGGGAEQTIGFAYKRTSGTGNPTVLRMFFNGFPTALFDLICNSNGTLTLRRQINNIASTVSAIPNDSNWHYFWVHYLIDASGFFKIYVDGVLKINYSGDTRGISPEGPATEIRAFGFGGASSTTILIDDVYVNSGEYKEDAVVETLFPSADGANTSFSPNAGSDHFSRVNNNPMDGDTTYVQSSASNQLDTYEVDTLGGTDVIGLQVNVLCKSTSGSANVRPVIRSNGVDYPAGANTSVSTSYVNVALLSDVDPDTTLTWDDTGVNAAEYGVKAI